MVKATRVHSTPPTNAPEDVEAGMAWWNALTKQERAKWSAIAGNTGRAKDAWEAFKRASMSGSELHPREVLADLLGSGDFPAEVLDPEAAAEIIMHRLGDAGFLVVSANPEDEE
jgi:hypothetical protein